MSAETGMTNKPEKKRRPSFPIYAGERLNDSALRACSREARSFAYDLECFAHINGEPYGFLTLKNGRPLKTAEDLAQHFPDPPASIKRWLRDLIANGVLAEDEAGVLCCPHLIETNAEREAWAERQAQGRKRKKLRDDAAIQD